MQVVYNGGRIETKHGLATEGAIFNGCVLQRDMENLVFVCCVFNACELLSDMTDSVFTSCKFNGCRFTGVSSTAYNDCDFNACEFPLGLFSFVTPATLCRFHGCQNVPNDPVADKGGVKIVIEKSRILSVSLANGATFHA